MTKITDTIYWTWGRGDGWYWPPLGPGRPVWKTDQFGDVVIVGRESRFPTRNNKRMTVEDMDAWPGCVRCDSLGVPLEQEAS